MKAKDKALELFDKYDYILHKEYNNLEAKQCALIAVNELTEAFINLSKEESGTTLIDYGQSYWQEVKHEIEKL